MMLELLRSRGDLIKANAGHVFATQPEAGHRQVYRAAPRFGFGAADAHGVIPAAWDGVGFAWGPADGVGPCASFSIGTCDNVRVAGLAGVVRLCHS